MFDRVTQPAIEAGRCFAVLKPNKYDNAVMHKKVLQQAKWGMGSPIIASDMSKTVTNAFMGLLLTGYEDLNKRLIPKNLFEFSEQLDAITVNNIFTHKQINASLEATLYSDNDTYYTHHSSLFGKKQPNIFAHFPKRYSAEFNISMASVQNILASINTKWQIKDPETIKQIKAIDKILREHLMAIYFDVKNDNNEWARMKTFSVRPSRPHHHCNII